MKRPGLDAMLDVARYSKEIHAVIAWERNRLARPKDPMDGMILERELLASGKKVIYVATGQEAGTSFRIRIDQLRRASSKAWDYLRSCREIRCGATFIERNEACGVAVRSHSGMTV